MAMPKRDTRVYRHKSGGRIQKIGITQQPLEDRGAQNNADGVKGPIKQIGSARTEETARTEEKRLLEQFKTRTGKLPPGNKQIG